MPEVVYSVEAREKKSVDVQVCLGEGKKDTDQSRDYSIQVDQVDFFVPLASNLVKAARQKFGWKAWVKVNVHSPLPF